MYRVLAIIIDLNLNVDMVSPDKFRVPIGSLVDCITQSKRHHDGVRKIQIIMAHVIVVLLVTLQGCP